MPSTFNTRLQSKSTAEGPRQKPQHVKTFPGVYIQIAVAGGALQDDGIVSRAAHNARDAAVKSAEGNSVVTATAVKKTSGKRGQTRSLQQPRR